MKLLEPEFKKRGFSYKLIQKNDKAFLYSISDGPNLRGYEVWKRKIQKAGSMVVQGVEVEFEECERFPSNNDFGSWAFAYITLPFAMKRFESISV